MSITTDRRPQTADRRPRIARNARRTTGFGLRATSDPPAGRAGERRATGFTLIETILSMVVISVVIVAVASLMMKGMDSYSLIVDRREALQKAKLAVNMMSSELVTITAPATDISAIAPDSITFTPAGGGSVRYVVSGTDLLRNTDVLAGNVTAQTGFLYYDATGASTVNPAQIHRIRITVEADTGNPASGMVTVRSDVYLRNRYYNAFIQN